LLEGKEPTGISHRVGKVDLLEHALIVECANSLSQLSVGKSVGFGDCSVLGIDPIEVREGSPHERGEHSRVFSADVDDGLASKNGHEGALKEVCLEGICNISDEVVTSMSACCSQSGLPRYFKAIAPKEPGFICRKSAVEVSLDVTALDSEVRESFWGFSRDGGMDVVDCIDEISANSFERTWGDHLLLEINNRRGRASPPNRDPSPSDSRSNCAPE